VAYSDSDFIPPSDGCTVKLTIDEWCQRVVESELAYAVESNQAKGGTVVVLEVKTGRVLAMASVPKFDLNEYKTSDPTIWKNPAVNLVYEPGSTMKPLIVASALEKGKVGAYTLVNCKNPLKVGEATITDVLRHDDTLSVAQVITKSSNVGISHIAMDLGGNAILHYLELMGIGEKSGIELPNESPGILHPDWVKTKEGAAFTAFGQGLALTPLQLACAINTIANNGVWIQPTIIDSIYDGNNYLTLPEQKRISVFSPEVAKMVALFMEEVVTSGGGKLAAVPGYRVAGKTGTSQKTKENGGGYQENNFVASFVGFAPVEDPQVLVLVMIDEPKIHLYGGSVSAPVFSRIMAGILQYLEISPSITKPLTLPDPLAICQLPDLPDFSDMTLTQIVKWAKSKNQTVYFEGEGNLLEDGKSPPEKADLQDYLAVSLKKGDGTMPKVKGLSVGFAYEMLVNLGLQVQVNGDGPLVIEQSPLPGEKLGEKASLTLGFTFPQKQDGEEKSNTKSVLKKKKS
jgi:stage V sporulation protein D (sporulation-specific penicillin-binding protein)